MIRHLICGNHLNWLENFNLIYETLWTGARSGLLISIQGSLNWFRLTDPITVVLFMWKWMGLFLRKNQSLRCWGWLSLRNCIGALMLSLASKKIGTLICSLKFLCPEFALYCYKSIIHPCMEYCCLGWCPYLLLGIARQAKKQICGTVCPLLATSLEPLAHHQNVASLSLFYRYYFGRCSSELDQMVSPPFSCGRSTCYSDRLHDFLWPFLRPFQEIFSTCVEKCMHKYH